MYISIEIIHNFTFHIPFPISSFHLFLIISLYFSFFFRLIQQANATQNFLREFFPPFSNSLTFCLFNSIDLRQITYFYNNSFPSAKESKILLNKTTKLCTKKFNDVIQLRAQQFYLQKYSTTSSNNLYD